MERCAEKEGRGRTVRSSIARRGAQRERLSRTFKSVNSSRLSRAKVAVFKRSKASSIAAGGFSEVGALIVVRGSCRFQAREKN